MWVDQQSPEAWIELNESLRRSQSWFSNASLQCYQSSGQALHEITSSLATLFSHKMSVALVTETGPAFDPIAIYFSKNGLNVQRRSYRDTDISVDEWVESLKRDTLFVALERDNLFTGELYDHTEIAKALTEKKIFQIYLSHNRHFYRENNEIHPYQIEICSLGMDKAVAFLGEKVQAPAHITPMFDWRNIELKSYSDLIQSQKEEKEKVLAFENQFGGESFFKGENRLFDRAVTFWRDLDGDALLTELSKRLGLSLDRAGIDPKWETSSLCRWQVNQPMKWLTDESAIQRGLVVFSKEILDQVGKVIPEARQHILDMQGGPWENT